MSENIVEKTNDTEKKKSEQKQPRRSEQDSATKPESGAAEASLRPESGGSGSQRDKVEKSPAEVLDGIHQSLGGDELDPFKQIIALMQAQMTPEILQEHAVAALKAMISNYEIQNIIKNKLKPELEAAVDVVLHSNEFRDGLRKQVNEQLIGIADTSALQLCNKLIHALDLDRRGGSGKG